MPDIIQLLPDSIANQIAAGEVVQRPASAVKELMENAIDAEATSIKLIVKDAGKTLVQVIDNGKGMSETDARMSLERHATSKIRKTEDLFTLHTMGFRGEALASIAAVSQLEMRTRPAQQELGTGLVVEASEVKKQEPVACEKGTSISVKNLFYNIPARRNFLKSNPVELKHIIDEFQRLALAHPEIAFMLVQGDEVVYDLQPGKLSQRIVGIFGKGYQEQLAACQEETNLTRVKGYVGKPDFARKTRGEQFLFVNRRFIRSNYLHHAVMSAFEGLLTDNSFPFYVIFIEIDPKHIDVNVHPTKTEIKFDDERAVYAVVRSAVRQAIGSHNLTPAIDFNADVNILSKLSQSAGQSNDVYFEERFSTALHRSNTENWEKLFEGQQRPAAVDQQSEKPKEVQTLRFESALNSPAAEQSLQEEKFLFQLHQRYLVRPVKSGMMILDQQLMHERILFERFLNQLRNKSAESQQSLFPQTITLSAADFALVMEMEQEITALGFRFEVFGKNTLLVNGIPANLSSGREKELFEGLLEQFKINQSELSLPLKENLARALARRACIKSGQKLVKEEMQSLIESLFACSTPNYAPDGRPTFFIFELGKIESYFSRQ
ncbi:DNA mismatch repair endonuclease MutL [Fulvivirgaceae bacterium PWU4]|uniref:DNA mismatch repair protein MutL n=1 Tax=Chryseosolibacter histidini TaxID=2782349 RepID=A0AAP2GT57_9BACT|nr:DNA mismatch repair endonuclease MutL [Chryseosolibacter histidini]MBT1701317.1 DNA mismatch repair endonuclease MutL [Chryseosolibacter histidini]